MHEQWVLDASHSNGAYWCYVPVDGMGTDDIVFIIGMNLMKAAGEEPNVNVVGVIHEDGQEAVEGWLRRHWPQFPDWPTPKAVADGDGVGAAAVPVLPVVCGEG